VVVGHAVRSDAMDFWHHGCGGMRAPVLAITRTDGEYDVKLLKAQ